MEDFVTFAHRYGLDEDLAKVFQRYAELWEEWQNEKCEEERVEHAREMSKPRR